MGYRFAVHRRWQSPGFYVWDSEEAAKPFFTEELVERVAGLYGVRPSVEFVQIATLVENGRPDVVQG